MSNDAITRQPFGRTGHDSSRVIFGAAALGGMSQSRADQTLAVLADFGINHIDTARSYGESELRLQPFLADHRAEFFLATKTGERTGAGARRELEESLTRMGVDHVDLIQLHNLVEEDEFETAHGAGGAVQALAKARDEGLVRFIGVTGHGMRIAHMHLHSLDRFAFDSVLLPYSFTMMQDPGYRADFDRLAEVCAQRTVAMQTIKSVARRRWATDSTEPHFSWYQPLPVGPALEHGVAYVLNRPQLFLNTSSDGRLLRPILEAAAKNLPLPTDAEMAADVAEHEMAALFDGAELERI